MKKMLFVALLATSPLQICAFSNSGHHHLDKDNYAINLAGCRYRYSYDNVSSVISSVRITTFNMVQEYNRRNHIQETEKPTDTSLGIVMDYIRSSQYDDSKGMDLRPYALAVLYTTSKFMFRTKYTSKKTGRA